MTNTSTWSLVLAAAVLAGCGGPAATPAKDAKGKDAKATGEAGHGHSHAGGHAEGPHGGTVADWGGGKYHVEFTVDHDKQESKVYILGGDAKSPEPITAKDGELLLSIKEPAFQVKLKAEPLPGESGGKASCYAGKHESLGKVQEFTGTISAEVDGTPYVGDFKEEPHDHPAPKK